MISKDLASQLKQKLGRWRKNQLPSSSLEYPRGDHIAYDARNGHDNDLSDEVV
jgi:hypothetical protein